MGYMRDAFITNASFLSSSSQHINNKLKFESRKVHYKHTFNFAITCLDAKSTGQGGIL